MGNTRSLVCKLNFLSKNVIVCGMNQKSLIKIFHKDGFHEIPEEVWQILLWKYLDSQDIQNFCIAYPLLYDVMHTQKQIWLFDQILPLTLKYIKKEDILNLRLVCKRWRRYVDVNLEKNHIPFKVFLYKVGLYGVNCNDLLHSGKNIKLQNINPYCLVGRSVRVTFDHTLNNDKNLNDFMSVFGHHISHLQLSVICSTTKTYIDYLCKVLKNCPYLKSIDFIGVRTVGGLTDEMIGCAEKYDPFVLYNRLKVLWPKSLKEICFEKKQQFKDSFLQNICATVLDGDFNMIGILRPCTMLKDNYNNIVKCDFEVKSCSQLVPLMNLKFPLQTLLFCLTFIATDTDGDFALMLLFKIIENFKHTLQLLRIQMTQSSLSFNNKGVRHSCLHLPSLKTLLLQNFPLHAFSSFCKLQSLETLVVYGNFDQSVLKQKDEIVEKLDYTGIASLMVQKMRSPYHEPYFSNLWNIFPKLKNFKFSNEGGEWPNGIARNFRRDVYEKHHLYCKFKVCKNRLRNLQRRVTF